MRSAIRGNFINLIIGLSINIQTEKGKNLLLGFVHLTRKFFVIG